jgi:hypothetical protein
MFKLGSAAQRSRRAWSWSDKDNSPTSGNHIKEHRNWRGLARSLRLDRCAEAA